jgi:hypothetical protein
MTCALLAALFLVLGFLLAAPGRVEASEPVPPVATVVVGTPSHHAASGAFGCHAVASCASGVIPADAGLRAAGAGGPALGRPPTRLAPASRAFAPDPPPPRA